MAAVSACGDPAARLERDVDAYVEQHQAILTESGVDVEAFRAYVLTICQTLATTERPDTYLAKEAGPDYWYWSDDPETVGRNSPDEPFEIAKDACNYEIVNALQAGINLYDRPTTTTAGVPEDPLDQMEIAFVGDYSRAEIKLRIDQAMDLYGMPINAENYSRAGSILVTLRKEYGPSEMEILDYMIRSYVSGVSLPFSDAAALAVVFLAAGDT